MPQPVLFYAAAGALAGAGAGVAAGLGGGWYLGQRGQQEAAKQLQRQDAQAAEQALRKAIDLADLRREAQEAGLDPDQVIAGYKTLRDRQVSPEDVLKLVKRATITD